jgi:hypothetical protein
MLVPWRLAAHLSPMEMMEGWGGGLSAAEVA